MKRLVCAAFLLLGASPAGSQGLGIVMGPDRGVVIRNTSRAQAIWAIHVTPPYSPTWGRNILGTEIALPPGQAVIITIANGASTCIWDVRVVFNNGRESASRNIDLCINPAWDFRSE
jgi:hypothetical protein